MFALTAAIETAAEMLRQTRAAGLHHACVDLTAARYVVASALEAITASAQTPQSLK
jgi:hypothetical protein